LYAIRFILLALLVTPTCVRALGQSTASSVATQLAFAVQPASSFAGLVITPGVQVVAENATGQIITNTAYPVTLSLVKNASGASLLGTTAASTGTNPAIFSALSVTAAGTGYTLTASSPGLASAVSLPFTVSLPPVSVTLATATVGKGLTTTGTVKLPAPAGARGVGVAISNNNSTSASALSSVVNIAPASTSGTFQVYGANLGSATLSFSAASASSLIGTSVQVSVVALPAAQLVFSVQPTNTTVASILNSSLRVLVEDTTGHEISSGSYPITLSLGNNPGGGVLIGNNATTWTSLNSGYFSGVSISQPGAGYTLVASSPGLASAVSAPFNVIGGAITVSLANSSVPVGISSTGTINLPAPAGPNGVSITISNGNAAAVTTGSSTVSIAAGQSSGNFSFSGVAAGTSTLTFSSPAYLSSAATVTTTGASQLVFSTQPANTTTGASLSPSMTVLVEDATGRALGSGSYPITLSIGTNPGGGVLNGTQTTTWTGSSSGSFPGISISEPGVGYTLVASSPNLASAVSVPFNVMGGSIAVSLATSSIPVGVSSSGTVTLPNPSGANGVTVSISNGNTTAVTTGTSSVSIAAGQSTGTFTYTGAATGTATLTFSAPAYVSSAATVTSTAASQLVFSIQPANTTAGAAINSSMRVLPEDTTGHEVAGGGYPITLSIGANPGGGILTGNSTTTWTNFSSGYFSGLSISQPGAGYTLIASSPGLASAVSAPFNVVGGSITVSLPSSSVPIGGSLTGTVTIPAPAGLNGVSVTISNGNAEAVATASSNVSIAAGRSSGTFTYSGVATGTSTLTFSSPAYVSSTATITASGVAIPGNYFGMEVLNFEGLTPSFSFGTARTWDAYPALDWADQNPSSGVYNFASLEAFLARSQASGRDVIYTFGRTPQWASSQPTKTGTYGVGQCAPPTNLQNWTNFVQAVVTQAAGRIKYWEMWDEPNDPNFYCGTIPTLVTMVQQAAQIIKSIDPTAQIVTPPVDGGSPLNGTPSLTWLGSFLNDGGAGAIDVVSFHGYTGGNAEAIVPMISQYKQLMQTDGVGSKPLWDTEGSWGASMANSTAAYQIGFVGKDYLLHWSSGVSRFVWYAYDGAAWGGMYTTATGPSGAATAYAQVYQWLEGAVMSSSCAQSAAKVFTCGLSRVGYSAEAVWIPNSTATFTVPSQFVEYRDLSGVIHPITTGTITIGDEPILLETSNLATLSSNSSAP
jgi:hypothetical protein